MNITALDWIAYVLVIIGSLNWGLVGLFKYNLVDSIFGVDSTMSRIIYVIVGLAGLYLIYTVAKLVGARAERTTI